ncbi:nitrite reductase large subunit NirB [Xylanimonas sp. McL0601]|uniref:nitrite reductase large subunit NirB n=1 Tax=Xylanimonas sp. McL0601 TaxID=3414739 RepID=UPI003CEDA54F
MPQSSRAPLDGDTIVVVGGGMTAHRFAQSLQQQDPDGTWSLTVIGDEPYEPYDRVHLSEWFTTRDGAALAMDLELWQDPRITLITGDGVASLDRKAGVVTTKSGRQVAYDRAVLATGSWAWTPRAEGTDLAGAFTYRTMADVERIEEWVRLRGKALGRQVRGVVVGGGVLGLEAAAALQSLGATATVVEFTDYLMSAQLDQGGGEMLRLLVEDRGMAIRTGVGATRFLPAGDGPVGTAELSDGSSLPADVVVFSVGIRPRDRVAREAGLAIGERGGVVVGRSCQTSDPAVWAIGECASFDGVTAGLIAPGNDMADVVVDRFLGGDRRHHRADEGTKLKGVGGGADAVDAASFGDVNAIGAGALEVSFVDPVNRQYRKLVVSDDAKLLLGGVFVGDIELYAALRPLLGRPIGADPAAVIAPDGGGLGDMELPDDAVVCSCQNVTAGTVRGAVTEHGCTTIGQVKECTKAGTVCGSCVPALTKLLNAELAKSGVEVSDALCEHFAMSRAELYRIIREEDLGTFSEVVAAHGTGRGCAICRPTVASILSSLTGRHLLEGESAALQDTNDHVMANMQRNGTYSVIPRMPGGEVRPDQLLEFAKVAQDYGLYVHVTGAQRLGMFGAQLGDLPDIWRRLVAVGFESGHAYGKSLRNIKTCVGQMWCRFGVQDSTTMAVRLEMRYRGLRSPHKLKFGVSGCARECAEARGKDVGIIATHKGWNLYIGGNGGASPVHAQLLAEDLDDAHLVKYIDRYLMLYIREADRLQRTAPWVAERVGGLDELRRVIVEDSLGIGAELEAAVQEHIDSYEDEWKVTLADPDQLKKFVTFINAPGVADPDLAFVPERGQIRPAGEADPITYHDPRDARDVALPDALAPTEEMAR